MISGTLVTSTAALDAYLTAVSEGAVAEFDVPVAARHLVTRVDSDGRVFLIHASDGEDTPRIVFAQGDCLALLPTRGNAIATALARANKVALLASAPPIRLSPAWSEYHHANLIAFFAVTRDMGNLRWLAQLQPAGSDDVFYCRLTQPSEPVTLQGFKPQMAEYRNAVRGWVSALDQSRKRFARQAKASVVQVVATVDLEAATFGAVVGHRTYSSWLPHLTDQQVAFLERNADVSTKVRGPAGSGKTLLLELKALHDTYAAPRLSPPRVLFVTHSWPMAEQVDAGLRSLHDQVAAIDNILVLPLLSIAQDLLPAERQGRGFELLGDDNLSGKALQLNAIGRILGDVVASSWLAFEDRCSPGFAERVTAPAGSTERAALEWDLMHEFACVLSASGILPGVNAARRYLPLHRMPWMMPLSTDADKLFVLQVYGSLVAELRGRGLLTSDQLINDFLNYLETFAWNLRRAEAGFDLIYVDELHLFNEQERQTLNFLSRDPDVYPVMFMALDPRQSPAEVYFPGASSEISDGGSGEADAGLGAVEALELTVVHRFSPEILELVRHINNAYPAFELGDDWSLDGDRLRTSAARTDELPTVAAHKDRRDECLAVARDAAARLASRGPDERVAIVLLDTLAIERYTDLVIKGGAALVLRGRDDVEALQYSKRAVVVSPAEYVAGLQFASVIVAGLPRWSQRRANLGHDRRRLLSLLYLAVSRATSSVSIHVNGEDGGIPEVLETAIASGIVVLK